MSYLYGFTFKDPTSNFLTSVIAQFKQLLAVIPKGVYGGTIQASLQYDAVATITDTVTLKFEGLVQYLYLKVYGTLVPTSPTDIEKEQIYSIYDALLVARPNL